jgi:hypothetical protein
LPVPAVRLLPNNCSNNRRVLCEPFVGNVDNTEFEVFLALIIFCLSFLLSRKLLLQP